MANLISHSLKLSGPLSILKTTSDPDEGPGTTGRIWKVQNLASDLWAYGEVENTNNHIVAGEDSDEANLAQQVMDRSPIQQELSQF